MDNIKHSFTIPGKINKQRSSLLQRDNIKELKRADINVAIFRKTEPNYKIK